MKKQPLISFCISTYRRPEFLKNTIEIILGQKYKNVEIVISEDPSDNTSEKMIRSFNSKKIIYIKNKTHLGMVKSFNKAFSLSHGDFVTILADDDPPTRDMLKIFTETLKKYPEMKAMFGASYANILSKQIEQLPSLKKGLNSLVNKKMIYGSTMTLEPKHFFKQFFKQEIFPHYLWNASLISRNLVKEVKGVPDYNSAHFSDYAYLLKIASKTEFIIINKELATFSLHEFNYGKKKNTLEEYKKGVIGFDKIISKLADKFNCKTEYENFLTKYIIMFLVDRLGVYKKLHYRINSNDLFKIYNDLSKQLKFLRKRRNEIYFKLNYYHIYQQVNLVREKYGVIKIKFINILIGVKKMIVENLHFNVL